MFLPDEIWELIYHFQMAMGDFNPTIFSKQYQGVVQRVQRQQTGWDGG